jgi:hypothetical protein
MARTGLLLAAGLAVTLLIGCDDDGGSRGAERETVRARDPCELASAEDVSRVVGTTVQKAPASGSATFGDVRTRGCTYQAQIPEGLLTAGVQTLGFRRPDDVRRAFAGVGEVEEVAVEGLPDTAFAVEVAGLRTIWVIDARVPFGVHVAVAEGSEFTDRPEQAAALARSVYEAP